MARLSCRTAGESHGAGLVALVEGLPAGLGVDLSRINGELARRQGGFGRSARQKLERDEARVLAGLIRGVTIGSPLALVIENKDHRINEAAPLTRPRPGHADFAGAVKYLTTNARPVVERASARETAARVAAGAVVRQLLEGFGIQCVGFVRRIGATAAEVAEDAEPAALIAARDASDVYCPDPSASARMIEAISAARQQKETLGGIVEARVYGCPPGLGSCMRWQDKLDGRLMRAVGSVQAIKAVEIGLGIAAAAQPGSLVHDPLTFDAGRRWTPALGFSRSTNHAGGIEGGMTNGMPIVLRAAMKPISTLPGGLDSVDLSSGAAVRSDYERSDVCAVPAASVIVENVVAFELAGAFLEKFGGDTLGAVRAAFEGFLAAARERFAP